jgi:hypothetical protein
MLAHMGLPPVGNQYSKSGCLINNTVNPVQAKTMSMTTTCHKVFTFQRTCNLSSQLIHLFAGQDSKATD